MSAVARRAWSWTSDLVVLRLASHLRLSSVSVMGRGEFGAITESGSASESQSQTRGTSMSVFACEFGAITESGSASESQSQTRGTSIVRRVVGYVSGWRDQLLKMSPSLCEQNLSD